MARERALFLSRVSSFFALAVVWLSSASSADDDVSGVELCKNGITDRDTIWGEGRFVWVQRYVNWGVRIDAVWQIR